LIGGQIAIFVGAAALQLGAQAAPRKRDQAFAARKDSGLIAQVNTALDQLRADGTLKQISVKYFGSDVSGK